MPYDFPTAGSTLLSSTDERELAKAIEAGHEARDRIERSVGRPGDEELTQRAERARERFIEANLRLVLSIAWRIKVPPHIDRDDLVQDGMLGLDRAVSGFDWRKGYKFSTYATWWIRQSIQRGLENTAAPVRIPAYRAGELRTALNDVDGDPAQLDPRMATVAMVAHPDSLDRPIGDGAHTVGDAVPSASGDPDRSLEAATDAAAVARMLGELDPITARTIVARFGLDGGDPATFAEIAATLGVSAEAVRRRVKRALRNLRPVATRLVADETRTRVAA